MNENGWESREYGRGWVERVEARGCVSQDDNCHITGLVYMRPQRVLTSN